MLGLGKVQVLESKLDIYENLSKEMLDKLERAVGTISENSNKVSIILERHENRLDENDRADQMMFKMFEELKEENRRQHEAVGEKISGLEKKVNDLIKFRWTAIGIAIAALTITQAPEIFRDILTPNKTSSNMVRAELVSFVNGSN